MLKHKFSIPESFSSEIPTSNIHINDKENKEDISMILIEVPSNFDSSLISSIKIKSNDFSSSKTKRLNREYVFNINNNQRETCNKVVLFKDNDQVKYFQVDGIIKIFNMIDESDRKEENVIRKRIIRRK